MNEGLGETAGTYRHGPTVAALANGGGDVNAKDEVREGWGAVLAVAHEVAVEGWW